MLPPRHAVKPAAQRPDRLRLGRIGIDRQTRDGALRAIEALVSSGRGGVVFTPNVDHVVLAERDPELRAAYAAADLSLADGMPLVWASRLLRDAIPEKVSGSDLVTPLAARGAALGWRIYLLGGAPGVAEAAGRRLHAEVGAHVVGTDAPRIALDAPDDTDAALARVAAARPDLVLVALGAPKQEIWIHRHRDRLAPAAVVGVGASLDFLAGRARRAPPWVSGAGLEWLWRLGHEPRRLWRRYLVRDPVFLAVLWRALRERDGSR